MSVSKRSPRNKARRKFIGEGSFEQKWSRGLQYEQMKKRKAESIARKNERIKKRKDMRAKRDHFERRGVL